jgi:transposase-like protein
MTPKRAQETLNYEIRMGRMKRPSDCEECGDSSKKLHGHHRSYSRPLDVQWLCPKCHSAKHPQKGNGKVGRPRILPDEAIIAAYRQGLTLRACAKRYRCSPEAIRLVLMHTTA